MRIQNLIEISKSNADLPEGRKYPIFYADPPWQYEHPPMGENRAIENHPWRHQLSRGRADRLGGFTSGLVVHRLHRDGRDL